MNMARAVIGLWLLGSCCVALSAGEAAGRAMLEKNCAECHDAETKKGDLDLSALTTDFTKPESFARWVKVHDHVASGEMPPKKSKTRPTAGETTAFTAWLRGALLGADRRRLDGQGRTALRRLTRSEYENTIRDLLDLPGIPLRESLPADGSAHGFDKHSDALDISLDRLGL